MVAAFVLISVQIRQEEAHLLALHGEGYATYRTQVRRWL
jgi:protein-S-isoprenylcysteine O-methyltransferase Ste14